MDTWRNVSHVSKFKKKKKKKRKGIRKKGNSKKEGHILAANGRVRERREKKSFKELLSKIYGNQTIGFRRSKRQCRSTHRELRVCTKILEFCQTPRGREFSYLEYF